MLSQIELRHFKCFDLLKLPLGALTFLSGANASGKSSVLQALALLHQTMREHEWSTRLMLNGAALQMGAVSDVVDKVNGRDNFEVGLVDGDLTYHWTFAGERDEMSLLVDRIVFCGTVFEKPSVLRYLLPSHEDDSENSMALRVRNLTYITAERTGPREVYPLEDRQTATVVGPAGEHAMSVLHWRRDEHIVDELVLTGAAPTLMRQTEERMRTFFDGCVIDVQPVPHANSVTLGIRTSDDTDLHRPIHAGFGITQVLPIVVAALSANTDDLLLIENPEVHLHPAGQALMGQFLADVARAGIQVLVESHSDHVLNGIRRSVKAERLAPEQVAMHFFRPRTPDTAQVVSPNLDSSGNIDVWPEGFFDQFDKDMNYFAGWGN